MNFFFAIISIIQFPHFLSRVYVVVILVCKIIIKSTVNYLKPQLFWSQGKYTGNLPSVKNRKMLFKCFMGSPYPFFHPRVEEPWFLFTDGPDAESECVFSVNSKVKVKSPWFFFIVQVAAIHDFYPSFLVFLGWPIAFC